MQSTAVELYIANGWLRPRDRSLTFTMQETKTKCVIAVLEENSLVDRQGLPREK